MLRYAIVFCLFSMALHAQSDYYIDLLKQYVSVDPVIEQQLHALNANVSEKQDWVNNNNLVLYEYYPALKTSLPRVALGDLPTPIEYLDKFSDKHAQGARVYIKREDLTTLKGFGGNKIRKLEFLLADALAHGAHTVMTYGCIGSNHATATASCAQQLGLRCINLLKPQPLSWVVRRNLLLMHEYAADMILVPSNQMRALQTVCSYVQNSYQYGDMPYLIPTGGSNNIGAIGYVNAALELKQQIDDKLLPMPDYIYIPVGSCGTISGFLVGARIAGITSRIKGIAVEPDDTFSEQIIALCAAVVDTLQARDSSFPNIVITSKDFEIVDSFTGTAYGESTQGGTRVTQLLKETHAIQLDGTYSAKVFAGMMHDLETGTLQDKKVLFWHTFCNHVELPNEDVKNLSRAFHQFFD